MQGKLIKSWEIFWADPAGVFPGGKIAVRNCPDASGVMDIFIRKKAGSQDLNTEGWRLHGAEIGRAHV